MPLLSHGTWILVADGEKALFMENVTDEHDPFFRVVRKAEQDNPPSHEQGSDRPGRYADHGAGQRSAVEETDWHRLAKERFADDLAELLYRLAHRNRFERLIVVAPPAVLGRLRSSLHKEVAERVVAEIDRDYTTMPVHEIERRVREALSQRAGSPVRP